MHYYELALKGYFLDLLTYESKDEIPLLSEVLAPLGKGEKNTKAIVLREVEKPNFKTKPVIERTGKALSEEQFELAKFISLYYSCKLAFVLGSFSCAKPYVPSIIKIENTPNLSDKQNEALEFIKNHDTSLLFADTGSGKTEIYISLIREYLAKGDQCLLLMPEISLTPQMQKRLEAYFKGHFAMWHSKITKTQKQKILSRFESGEISLIAGARSALYLPFSRLKLIIVDEEHDHSYKANDNPRINARDLALFLGKKLGIKVLLGSATPSLTSFYKQPVFRLKGTFFESSKEFIFDESEPGISSTLLRELCVSLRAKKQAIIFLPSRANFRQLLCQKCGGTIKCPFCSVAMSLHKKKNALKCHYCGFMQAIAQTCPNCGGLILEAKKMGTAELVDRLQDELCAKFSNVKIAQFDSDSLNTQKKLVSILSDFNDKKIDILVGTSMLAKGHDYHNVDLSVVLGLDEYLYRPNFRAKEETLTLAMQVAGRAGRVGAARVLVQSKQRAFFERFIKDYDGFLREELNERKGLYPPFTRLLRIVIEDKNQEKARILCEDLAGNLRQNFTANLHASKAQNTKNLNSNLKENLQNLAGNLQNVARNASEKINENSSEILAENSFKNLQNLAGNLSENSAKTKALQNNAKLEIVGSGACGIELINNKFRFYILLRSIDYKMLLRAANFALNFSKNHKNLNHFKNATNSSEITIDIDPVDFA